jgi:N-acetylglucosamine kinase-like BadF-type ATPase
MYVLGIDGGGTKTTGVIADEKGRIFGEATVGATNPNSVEASEVKKALVTLDHILQEQSGKVYSQVSGTFAGMSGVGHETSKKEMHEMILTSMQISDNVIVDNDALTALYSGTLGEPGIVQISGTGSITFGINQQKERGRVGGWGHLIGEEGSGYALGKDGLHASFLAHDGMNRGTRIHDLLLNELQVDTLPDCIHSIYHAKNRKETIASFSRFVIQAADEGDRVARKIIYKHGVKIGESIVCLIQKLFTVGKLTNKIPVVLAGGLFNRFDLFQASMNETLRSSSMNVMFIIPEMDPVAGAVIGALREGNVKVDDEFPSVFTNSD